MARDSSYGVQPTGSRLWRLAHRFDGEQKLLALGSYPLISLAEVVTCEANEMMAQIHPRMPVIIAPEEYQRWLSFEVEDPRDLLRPFPAEKMKMWPVSRDVGRTANNRPDLVDPIEVAKPDEPEPPLL